MMHNRKLQNSRLLQHITLLYSLHCNAQPCITLNCSATQNIVLKFYCSRQATTEQDKEVPANGLK